MEPEVLRSSSCSDPRNNNMTRVQARNGASSTQVPKCPAVQVINATKAYANQKPVLNDFNMTVQQGTIYALLGSSGCGKTTMLSCIVGSSKIDKGDVYVFGNRPGTAGSGIPGRRIGYMPQDIALYPQLSIQEMFEYFGRLYGMTESEIGARLESLTHFLDLPPRTRIIETLSGGQQRRASLAASLLHEPPLLILDEPTVGVDPLLRESIWNHLLELVTKRQTTVIITTHYIEEARNSHTVGLMRNGRLLVEKGPQELLKEYNVTLLEDIVLDLCKMDSRVTNGEEGVSEAIQQTSFYNRKVFQLSEQYNSEYVDQDGVTGLKFRKTSFSEELHVNTLPTSSAQAFLAGRENEGGLIRQLRKKVQRIRSVTIRNIILLYRSPLIVFILFGIPILDLSISSYTLGPTPKNLKFGVISPEISNNLSHCSSVVHNDDKCELDKISCRFLANLPEDILILESRNSVAEALQDVENGKLMGYMDFPKDYSNHTVDKLVSSLYAEKETLVGATVSLRMDMSSYIAAYLVQKSIYESYQRHGRRLLKSCDQDVRRAELPLNYRKPIYGTEEGTSEAFINAAVMIITLYFLAALFCANTVLVDRQQGTLERSKITGLTHMEMNTAYIIINGFIVILQILVCYFILFVVFKTPMNGSSVTYLALLFMNGIGGLSFGLLISEIFHDILGAYLIGAGLFISSLSSCGVIWPLEASSYWIRTLVGCIPFASTIPALRSVQGRGWGITHPHIYYAFLLQIGWVILIWNLATFIRRARAP